MFCSFLLVCLFFNLYLIRKDILLTFQFNKGAFYFISPFIIIFLIIILFKKEKWTKGDILVSFSILITISFFLFQLTNSKVSKMNAIVAADRQNCEVVKGLKKLEGENLGKKFNSLYFNTGIYKDNYDFITEYYGKEQLNNTISLIFNMESINNLTSMVNQLNSGNIDSGDRNKITKILTTQVININKEIEKAFFEYCNQI